MHSLSIRRFEFWTYSLSLLVGGGELFALVLQATEFDLQLVVAAVDLGQLHAGVRKIVCKYQITLIRYYQSDLKEFHKNSLRLFLYFSFHPIIISRVFLISLVSYTQRCKLTLIFSIYTKWTLCLINFHKIIIWDFSCLLDDSPKDKQSGITLN